MEFAIASGVMAAQAIITATGKKISLLSLCLNMKDCSKNSFVLKDMATFKMRLVFSIIPD